MSERNRFVDTLKGIFIIFVIMLHFPYETGETNRFLFPFWVTMAVPCFMFISGYVSALSFKKKGFEKLGEMYAIKGILKRLLRFVIPFTIAFIAEWIVFRIFKVYLVNVITYGLRAFCLDWLTGGKGQGSYYFPVMIQLVIVFPIIYLVIKKFKIGGLAGCFIANAAFDALATFCGMSDAAYRLLFFRYLFVVAAGTFFALEPDFFKSPVGKITGVCSLILGISFIFLFSYADYEPHIFTMWRTTSMLTCLYIIPILCILIGKCHKGFGSLELAGKASFNIFLVQMIYYNFVNDMAVYIPSRPLLLMFNILNCCIAGILFYIVEKRFTDFIISKLFSKN